MAVISGTAQDVAFTQPSAIGGFFGNNSVIFTVAPDSPFQLPGGTSLDLVPVRLDCFIRLPNFDGLKIDVVGDYDDFDGIFRADAVEVKKLGVKLGGAKYFSLWFSIVLVCVVFALLVVAVLFGVFISTRNFEYGSPFIVIAYFIALSVVATLTLAYVKRVAISVIAEKCDRLLRRFTEYRSTTSGITAVAVAEKLLLQARERLFSRILLVILSVGLVAAGYGLFLNRYVEGRLNWFRNVRPFVLSAEAEKALQPLAKFQECKAGCPEMVVVPAGKFLMGSPATEPGRDDDEGPQHEVTVAKAFAVAKFDVKVGEWEECVSAGACQVGFRFPDGDKNKSMPMAVSWEEARQYVDWLSKLTGKPYRLLSESEWEYAARAGTTTAYYWGDDIGAGNAVCQAGCGDLDDSPQPVGSLKPNAFGLYDMAGNVWQWVQDCYQEKNYEGAPADGSARTSGDCNQHAIRGGSFLNPPADLRSAARDWTDITVPGDGSAVRVARDLASQ